jgi:hypothetical protein
MKGQQSVEVVALLKVMARLGTTAAKTHVTSEYFETIAAMKRMYRCADSTFSIVLSHAKNTIVPKCVIL